MGFFGKKNEYKAFSDVSHHGSSQIVTDSHENQHINEEH